MISIHIQDGPLSRRIMMTAPRTVNGINLKKLLDFNSKKAILIRPLFLIKPVPIKQIIPKVLREISKQIVCSRSVVHFFL